MWLPEYRLRSEKRAGACVIVRIPQSALTCTQTAQPTTHLGYTVRLIPPRLQTCTACYCPKQQEIKSHTRENE